MWPLQIYSLNCGWSIFCDLIQSNRDHLIQYQELEWACGWFIYLFHKCYDGYG